MLEVKSACFVRDIYDQKRETIWVGGEQYDKLEIKGNPPYFITIKMIVEYHFDKEPDGLIEFRVYDDKEEIHKTESDLQLSYKRKNKSESREHFIRDISFPHEGSFVIKIVHRDSILYSLPLTLIRSQ